MDTITHAVSGALATRAGFSGDRRTVRVLTVAGALAAAFPDIDFVTRWIGPLEYLNLHRGVTHSFVLLPLWAALVAALLRPWWSGVAGYRTVWGVCAVAMAVHILGDGITSYGTQVLAPFSDWKLAWSTTFIIDPWLSACLVIGLWLSIRHASRRAAVVAWAVALAYIGMQWQLSQQARALGVERAAERGWAGAMVTTLPQPFSPFHWKIVVRNDVHYDIAYVDLAGVTLRLVETADAAWPLAALYRPRSALTWRERHQFGDTPEARAFARAAWEHPKFEAYREFAVLPVLWRLDPGPPPCAWFTDQRFSLDGWRAPFRYGMCRDEQGRWGLYRLGWNDTAVPIG